jgi:dsRNA-specific ribonuclease
MKAEQYHERNEQVGRWQIHIVSYKFDDKWVCTVDNVSPGANVASATAASREEAEKKAIERAKERLAATRVVPV